MINSKEFIEALADLEEESGIDKATLLEALELALVSAYKKNYGSSQNARVSINEETGEIKVYDSHEVVPTIDDIVDDELQITEEYAKRFNPDIKAGETLEIEITPDTFGRIAAQTAKQVVMQRIREAERGIIYDQYADKENTIMSAAVSRVERGNVYVQIGKAEGMIPASETVYSERYNVNDRIKVYIIEVKKTNKGPQIICSRTHPNLVQKLFELEVPEIRQNLVEIKSIAREAGQRTKISVASNENDIDPVGACVGHKGMRIEHVVEELKGEKIDVVPWSLNPIEYIGNALRPAKVVLVQVNEDEKSAKVIVPDYQLSLAIGKEGQNVRLAAKLTGWKIDIKSQSQSEEEAFGRDDEDIDEEEILEETETVEEEARDVLDDLSEEEISMDFDEELSLDD